MNSWQEVVLNRVYILVVIALQNNWLKHGISHITCLGQNPGLVWWLHSHQESRHLPSYCFDPSGCYFHLHDPCHYVQILANNGGKDNRKTCPSLSSKMHISCLLTSHWLQFNYVAILSCRRGWENILFILNGHMPTEKFLL